MPLHRGPQHPSYATDLGQYCTLKTLIIIIIIISAESQCTFIHGLQKSNYNSRCCTTVLITSRHTACMQLPKVVWASGCWSTAPHAVILTVMREHYYYVYL